LINNPSSHATPGLFVDVLQATAGPGGTTNYTVRASGTVDALGNFQVQLPFDLTDGPITLVSRFRDQAGNVGATYSTPLKLHIVTVAGDYNGDGKADLAVYRTNSQFLTFNLANGAITTQFLGLAGDIPVQADFDGDGKTDFAVYRPGDGTWAIFASQRGLYTTKLNVTPQAGDVPVPADFDGDGLADPAIFRPSTGEWFYNPSSGGATTRVQFGQAGDVPVPADYTGDFQADFAVYRPSTVQFRYLNPKTNAVVTQFLGLTGDVPVPLDYSGDGRADFAVYRPSNSQWVYMDSTSRAIVTQFLGLTGDVPVPLDYNGDGRADFAVYRPNGQTTSIAPTWAIFYTNTSAVQVQLFGLRLTDLPVAAPPAFRLPSLIGPNGYQPYGGSGGPPSRAMAAAEPTSSSPTAGPAPTTDPGTIATPSVPGVSPRVAGVRLEVGRDGNVTALVIQFNEAMDAASATNLAHYSLRPDRAGAQPIRLRAARYDAMTKSVSLVPKGPLAGGRAYRLTVRDIADSTGLALDGNADGTPGGAFTTLVRRLALGRPVAATIPVVSKMVPSGPVSARRSRLPLK
jgi:hypothetical protein